MSPSADCIFCKIISGDLPSIRVYEDHDVLAFMDIGPVVKGHTLVVPKQHHDPITRTPVEVLCRLIRVVQQIAEAQITGLKADGINVTQANGRAAGQIVPHIHFHVIPRFATDGHHWNWVPRQYDSPEEIQSYADRIREALRL
jgi:histidine triad (HIT) family protein